jgi:hypothetical protein
MKRFYTLIILALSYNSFAQVGINTTTPTSMLDVNGQVTIDQKNFGGYGGLLIKGNAPGSNYPNICFSTTNTSGNDIISSYIGGSINSNAAGFEAMDLVFLTSQNGLGSLSERMRIKDNGYIGIGNPNPSQKLDITGKIKITDGTEGTGKVLVSDATGVASWVTTNSIKSAVTGVFAGGGASFGNGTPIGGSSVMTYCNAYIDLPVGKWMVFGTYLLAGATILTSGQSAFIRTSLYTSDTVSGSNPYIVSGGLISGILAGPTEFGIANGQTIINNTSGGTIRFYLWANIKKYGTTPATFGMSGVGSAFWSENQLTAIPMN